VTEWTKQDGPDNATTTCVIASSKKMRDALARHFQSNGLHVAVIDENQNAGATHGTTYFATMHRAKGLEFDKVIVLAPKTYLGDPLETDSKRKLIYVAMTRAKKEAAMLTH
jgi:superfamily I DNA/RNA helicase